MFMIVIKMVWMMVVISPYVSDLGGKVVMQVTVVALMMFAVVVLVVLVIVVIEVLVLLFL